MELNIWYHWKKWRLQRSISRFDFPEYALKNHTHITGGTMSGKSTFLKGLILKMILSDKFSTRKNITLIDPHEDLSKEVYSLVKTYFPEIKINMIDLTAGGEHIPRINPFLFSQKKTIQGVTTRAQEIVEVFREILKGDFSDNMEAILYPCITTLLFEPYADLKMLQSFLNNTDNYALIERGKKNPIKNHREFFEQGFHNKNFLLSKQALYSRIQVLLNDYRFAEALSLRYPQ